MKLILFIILILYSIHSFSQTIDKPKDSVIQKNESGVFRSLLKATDSLKQAVADSLNPSMLGKVNKLDEVIINSNSKYNAITLGIISKEIPQLSINERRLYTAGDFKPIHLLSLLGGSLEIDPIINAISGRTKRLKKFIKIEVKESNLHFLEDHFMGYMVENLNIGKEHLGRFLNFLVENENLQELLDRKDYGELHFFIGDEWFKFKEILDDSTPMEEDKISSENKQ